MNSDGIATTYAQALLGAAVEKGLLDQVLEEVDLFAGLLRDDRRLGTFIVNPRIEKPAKLKSLESALRGKLSDTFVSFLLLVIDKGRQVFLAAMLQQYKALHDEKAGIVRAEAVSAVPLSEDALHSLTSNMSQKLDKRILVTNRVDPGILGGLVIRFAGQVADGSLKTSLDELRSSLTALKFGSEMVHEN